MSDRELRRAEAARAGEAKRFAGKCQSPRFCANNTQKQNQILARKYMIYYNIIRPVHLLRVWVSEGLTQANS